MPLNSYYKGHGDEVMSDMSKRYGPEAGKRVFYATTNKRGLKAAAEGDTGVPGTQYDTDVGPMPLPPQQPSIRSPYDQVPIASRGVVPPMGTSPNMPMPPRPPMPIGPPPNTQIDDNSMPSPVLNTGQHSSIPIPSQSQIGQGPMARAASQAGQDLIKEYGKKTPWWKEALGVALTAAAPMAGRLSGVPAAVGGKLTGDDEKRKALQKAANLSALSDEERKQQTGAEASDLNRQRIQTEMEARRTQADTRETNALTRKMAVEASKAHIEELKSGQVRKWVEDQIGKSRMEDASYQSESAPMPQRWEFIKNPEKPGEGWAVPPSWSPVPTELATHMPGYKVDDLAPHSALKQAVKDYNTLKLEGAKATDRSIPLEDRVVQEYIRNHPGTSLADARRSTAVKPPTEPVPPGTWTLQETPDGKSVLMNTKTGETRDSGGLQRPGTFNKAAEAKEKLIGPVRDAKKYAEDYLSGGQPTGPGDEALMEKFFELAKPSTGFRMTQNQMDMLRTGRSWLDTAKAHGTHGANGEWFDANQRQQIVQTMKDLAKAKGVGVPAPGNPQAPIGPPASAADDFIKRNKIGQ